MREATLSMLVTTKLMSRPMWLRDGQRRGARAINPWLWADLDEFAHPVEVLDRACGGDSVSDLA
ncbi:hypothetical protein CXZ10_09910 [Pleomorphomonas diazotrophica]|uniref:Uncharacterized protein n=1 Tax=Pleomorphomonas diazotrophica TaxID=1166257 RepID=A0A2N3LYK9_9HYPH|nr:hypothetical protein CXZ10_09910 [Pleomorphomonas diazotrophica]